MTDSLQFVQILERPDLVAAPVAECVASWRGTVPATELCVAEIDPLCAGGVELCDRYGFRRSEGANCVIVEYSRGATSGMGAVVIPVGARADFNGVARKLLGARRVSLGQLDAVLELTRMEYGSITPVGLPSSWPILIDATVAAAPRVIVGSGVLRSKLSLPGRALAELPGAVVVEGLARLGL